MRHSTHRLTICGVLLVAAACAPLSTPTTLPPTATPEPRPITPTPTVPGLSGPQTAEARWWNDAIFYEIFVRSFQDSNADGIGDFNGIIARLDYLNDGDPATTTDLGITAVWLMPIHPSPSTHGYDVTDYYDVNPQYGTLDEFRQLVDEARRRGIRVIIDLVLNHTSNQHPWFVQSQDPASPHRDWYIWSASDPGYRGPWNQIVWHPAASGFYYGLFWEGMPDLNYRNPDVTAEMHNVARFWLQDIGIDGFRLDAIGGLIEDGAVTVETPSTHLWLRGFYAGCKEIRPDAFTVGEVWNPDDIVAPYIINRETDLAFEFDLAAAILASVNNGTADEIRRVLVSGSSLFPAGQYGTFITNHDMARVMTQLGGDAGRAKAAASVYLTLPGVPFIYYGEEIGMVGEAPEERGRRPMQWTGGPNAEFSAAAPWKPVDAGFPAVNVAAQETDPASLLHHYRRLVALRNHHSALRTGALTLVDSRNAGVFASLRVDTGEVILVVINLTGAPASDYGLSLTSLSPRWSGQYRAIPLLGAESAEPLTVLPNGQFRDYRPLPELPPYGTLVLQMVRE